MVGNSELCPISVRWCVLCSCLCSSSLVELWLTIGQRRPLHLFWFSRFHPSILQHHLFRLQHTAHRLQWDPFRTRWRRDNRKLWRMPNNRVVWVRSLSRWSAKWIWWAVSPLTKISRFSSYAGHWQRYSGNGPSGFYGHVTYTNVSPNIQCLTASKSPYEGASLKLADCQYDYDSAATSGQYFE